MFSGNYIVLKFCIRSHLCYTTNVRRTNCGLQTTDFPPKKGGGISDWLAITLCLLCNSKTVFVKHIPYPTFGRLPQIVKSDDRCLQGTHLRAVLLIHGCSPTSCHVNPLTNTPEGKEWQAMSLVRWRSVVQRELYVEVGRLLLDCLHTGIWELGEVRLTL